MAGLNPGESDPSTQWIGGCVDWILQDSQRIIIFILPNQVLSLLPISLQGDWQTLSLYQIQLKQLQQQWAQLALVVVLVVVVVVAVVVLVVVLVLVLPPVQELHLG
jgi:uncharacterized paraquat-inducible protein A